MIQIQSAPRLLSWLSLLLVAPQLGTRAAEPQPLPPVTEILELVRDHMEGLSAEGVNDAAVRGLLRELQPRAVLSSAAAADGDAPPAPALGGAALYEKNFGYVRVDSVEAGLATALRQSLSRLKEATPLEGVILDLRFAGGYDYTAAAEAADLLAPAGRVLLSWDGTTRRSTSGTQFPDVPVVVLVNAGTEGAAEALAEVLRQTATAVILGRPTAGRAFVFHEFAVSSGQTLRLAGPAVRVADDLVLDGVVSPDIEIASDLERERASRGSARLSTGPETGELATEPPAADSALRQALDVLKGVALVRRSGSA